MFFYNLILFFYFSDSNCIYREMEIVKQVASINPIQDGGGGGRGGGRGRAKKAPQPVFPL